MGKKGICTSYIQQAPVGSKIPCAAYCGTFKFPLEDTTPMVMVGLGTGIAPVRAFLQDKMYKRIRELCQVQWLSSMDVAERKRSCSTRRIGPTSKNKVCSQ